MSPTIIVQVLLVSSLHLTIFALNVALWYLRWSLVVADIVVDLVVDRLLHYVPVSVSLR